MKYVSIYTLVVFLMTTSAFAASVGAKLDPAAAEFVQQYSVTNQLDKILKEVNESDIPADITENEIADEPKEVVQPAIPTKTTTNLPQKRPTILTTQPKNATSVGAQLDPEAAEFVQQYSVTNQLDKILEEVNKSDIPADSADESEEVVQPVTPTKTSTDLPQERPTALTTQPKKEKTSNDDLEKDWHQIEVEKSSTTSTASVTQNIAWNEKDAPWNNRQNIAWKIPGKDKDKLKILFNTARDQLDLNNNNVYQNQDRFDAIYKALKSQIARSNWGISPTGYLAGIRWSDRLIGIRDSLQYIVNEIKNTQTPMGNQAAELRVETIKDNLTEKLTELIDNAKDKLK